ncbi:MAG: molybdopterin-dependent oxidoreductase [Deltaproteobacteria bacterium]|nr:molybdopterin-dependent oxidoreductase [Deltaproteobacteria bacterium]
MTTTVFRTCTLCEACCGLRFEVEGDRILSVRPDDDDVLSRGFACPKGIAIADVHHDPDRLRTPMRRDATGQFHPIGWDEALDLAAERLRAVQRAHGHDAVAVYLGNPIVHNHGVLMLRGALLAALKTRNATSASSQDTAPRFATSYHLYGSSMAIPIPDVDRTDYFLCIGANPLISNGSFLSAPNMKERLRAVRARGGKVIVVDPRRSETAREADEHVAIRPGTDAAFLLAMVHVLQRDGRVDRAALDRIASGWDAVAARLAPFAPERVALHTGVPAETIVRLAHDFANAPTATAYSRIGVCNNIFGTLATWATDLLNAAAGRLGAVGGALFTSPAIDICTLMKLTGGDGHDRWRTRVRGLPETLGDIPTAALAEEIETPGPGQVRALLTFAGNPVLSAPNGRRLSAALGQLDFMVAIDLYVNETTRHADLILPPAWSLAEEHVDVVFSNFFARNAARWSPPVVERQPGEKHDWEIILALIDRLGGGPTGQRVPDAIVNTLRKLGWHWTPESGLDAVLRLGRYGDKFRPWSKGLNRRKLAAAPHGIDLGPLEPGVARRVAHKDGLVHLAAAPMLAALGELEAAVATPRDADELLLVGRREQRTCNSWMHNVEALVRGRERCVLYVHPDDAARAGVADGELALLESRVHQGPLRIQVTDEMRPGVVSLPHGWGHAAAAPWQRVAGAHPGTSANDWTDDQQVETIVGQSVLNGVPVRLRRFDSERHSAAV